MWRHTERPASRCRRGGGNATAGATRVRRCRPASHAQDDEAIAASPTDVYFAVWGATVHEYTRHESLCHGQRSGAFSGGGAQYLVAAAAEVASPRLRRYATLQFVVSGTPRSASRSALYQLSRARERQAENARLHGVAR